MSSSIARDRLKNLCIGKVSKMGETLYVCQYCGAFLDTDKTTCHCELPMAKMKQEIDRLREENKRLKELLDIEADRLGKVVDGERRRR